MNHIKIIIGDLISWIREWFEENGPDKYAVIGISGGKDSSVVAALMVAALGKERVFGVLMPNGEQPDIDYSQELVKYLGIKSATININDSVMGVIDGLKHDDNIAIISKQAMTNLPPRIRMTTLYAVSQTIDGRVINTSNASEGSIGYSTRYGDSVGDMAPIARFTAEEVIEIGKFLKLPKKFLIKPPSDGLCGKTDEENIGFSYSVLDKYIRTGVCEDEEIKKKIDERVIKNKFKQEFMETFEPQLYNHFYPW
jgi:NAD+ synthase